MQPGQSLGYPRPGRRCGMRAYVLPGKKESFAGLKRRPTRAGGAGVHGVEQGVRGRRKGLRPRAKATPPPPPTKNVGNPATSQRGLYGHIGERDLPVVFCSGIARVPSATAMHARGGAGATARPGARTAGCWRTRILPRGAGTAHVEGGLFRTRTCCGSGTRKRALRTSISAGGTRGRKKRERRGGGG